MARASALVKPPVQDLLHLKVLRTQQLSHHWMRITLGGGEIEKFTPLGFDQWFRIFLPLGGDEGLERIPAKANKIFGYLKYLRIPDGVRPVMRNYSVRAFRPATEARGAELDVDFVIHGSGPTAGPASRWAQSCRPGESVVINCGSTAFLLGREMCGKPVQIITNYLPLANYLIDQEHESVVIMGGQYNKSQSITLSPQDSENSLYAGHWMFTSGKGLTADGLYKTDMLTAMAEQNMLNVVGKLVVLVDSSKVGERAGMLFSRAEQIDLVITGKGANPEILQKLEDQGVKVLRV